MSAMSRLSRGVVVGAVVALDYVRTGNATNDPADGVMAIGSR